MKKVIKKTKAAATIPQNKNNAKNAKATGATNATRGVDVYNFTFGGIENVHDKSEILNFLACNYNGRYFEPPVSFDVLANTFNFSPYHSSPVYVKRNILSGSFKEHKLLNKANFSRLVLDLLVFGNCYLEKRLKRGGGVLEFAPVLAKHTRINKDNNFLYLGADFEEHIFSPGAVYQVKTADINQELYGVPEYLAALNGVWLDKAATVFRRRYYQNGAHAGFILYLTNPQHSEQDIDNIKTQLNNSRGSNNFRNLILYTPNGAADDIKLIPLNEIAAKDSFEQIKEISRDDVLAAHRVPPLLLGVTPKNTGGFGDPEKALKVFLKNEILPLASQLKAFNDFAGCNLIDFNDFDFLD